MKVHKLTQIINMCQLYGHPKGRSLYKLNPIFHYRDAIRCGMTKRELNALVSEDKLVKTSHGVYSKTDQDTTPKDVYREVCSYLGDQSAISFMSALEYYDLTDLIPNQTWVIVNQEKRSVRKDLKLVRLRNPRWDIEIIQKKGVRIVSMERALVESIYHPNLVGRFEGILALKQAFARDKTTLNRLYKVAKDLEMLTKISPIIETLM